MGLLDELKQEAEIKRAEAARVAEAEQARLRDFQERIHPRVVRLFTFLSELAEHLNFIAKPVRVSYPIKTYAVLRDLVQQDYKIRSDSMEAMREIDFSFDCVGEERVEFEVENKLYIERLEEYLSSARLNFTCHKSKDNRHNVTSARFRVDAHVPVRFEFKVDVDAGVIRLVMRNYHGLHVDHFSIDPEHIDQDYLDELGKFILRQESQLFRLEMSEEERQQLRRRLEAEKKGRASGPARAEKKAAKKRRKSFLSRKTDRAEPPETPGPVPEAPPGPQRVKAMDPAEAARQINAAAAQQKEAGETLPEPPPEPLAQAEAPEAGGSAGAQDAEVLKPARADLIEGVTETPSPGEEKTSAQKAKGTAAGKGGKKVAGQKAAKEKTAGTQTAGKQTAKASRKPRAKVAKKGSESAAQKSPAQQSAEAAPATAKVETDPAQRREAGQSRPSPLKVKPDEVTPAEIAPAEISLAQRVDEIMAAQDRDDDLSGFELQFASLPAAYKPYAPVDEEGRTALQRLADLEAFPAQLLKEAVHILRELNHTTMEVNERVEVVSAIFAHCYPVMLKVYYQGEHNEAPLHDKEEENMLESSIEMAEETATAYKHAFVTAYTTDRLAFGDRRGKLALWGFRILEMIRLEQRLRALRYQKLPNAAWLDANQVFFSLLLHEQVDDGFPLETLIGLTREMHDAELPRGRESSIRRVYLSIQLFGVLDVISWPAYLFHFPDDYLEEMEGGLHTEQDSGEKLEQGWLITFLRNDGPPLHQRNDAIPAPALRINFGELFQRIVAEHEALANMLFLNAVDEDKLSPSLVELESQDRIPVLEMMLLALQRRERRHVRHAVFGTEKLSVSFGFAACYTNLSGFAVPHDHQDEKALAHIEQIQQASIELAESSPPFHTVPWKLINFSTGGLLVANDSGHITQPMQVGQLVSFKPRGKEDLPLIGYIGRIQRPIEYQVEISIIRMAKYAEAALAQDSKEMHNGKGKPVVLTQDFEGRWQLVALPGYNYVTGTPLKLVRADGSRILLRLGDIWLTKRDFKVFEVRSANLE